MVFGQSERFEQTINLTDQFQPNGFANPPRINLTFRRIEHK
jgi:hypothetical protein